MPNKEQYQRDKEKYKQYREKNKERIKENSKEYREKNKERIREYRENNKEQGKKSNRINTWKQTGVKSDDFNSLYDYYLNCKNCEECSVELVEGRYGNNRKCLDHDHITGEFRNVLCHTCNIKRWW